MGQMTELTAADGHTLGAYVAAPEGTPKGAPKGAIVVIQEIFGVNVHIREVVDGYAADGYYAIAPAIFDRIEKDIQLGYEESDMTAGVAYAFEKLQISDALQDVQAAVNEASNHGKVGVVGYCFGGLLTWLSATDLSGITAASVYYGGGLVNEAGRDPKCPVIMHFGALDEHIPLSDVDKIKEANPDVPVYVYDADHGFNCNHRGSYDAASSALAKERTLEFFGEKLA